LSSNYAQTDSLRMDVKFMVRVCDGLIGLIEAQLWASSKIGNLKYRSDSIGSFFLSEKPPIDPIGQTQTDPKNETAAAPSRVPKPGRVRRAPWSLFSRACLLRLTGLATRPEARPGSAELLSQQRSC
jgi:hypothetical protein